MAYFPHLLIFPFSFLSLLLLILLPFPSHCTADPSPLQDFCVADLKSPFFINGFPCKKPSEVTSKDFFHDGLVDILKPIHYDYLGVDLKQANVFQFPGLNTLGMSMNRVTLRPGGLNSPHVHPRASELSIVAQGRILVGLVSTDYTMYGKILSSGELFIIPQGLMHFELNVGRGNARFYASFNSQNPGIQRLGLALFNTTPTIPDEVLVKALQVNQTIVDLIKDKFSKIKPSVYSI